MEDRQTFPWLGVGIIFLVIIFGSVALFLKLSNKRSDAIVPSETEVSQLDTSSEVMPLERTPPTPVSAPTPPIEVEPLPPAEPPPPPLPKLNESDTSFKQNIAELSGGTRLLALLVNEELIRKGVRMVHGLSEGFVVKEFRPIYSPEGRFEVSATGEVDDEGASYYVMSEKNLLRYAKYIEVLQQVKPQQVAELYHYFYPLLQQAYEELGLRERSFHKVLNKAIDQLMQPSPPVSGMRLRQPSVMYVFDDADVESSSGVNKLKLRIGSEASAALEQWLAEFRRLSEIESKA